MESSPSPETEGYEKVFLPHNPTSAREVREIASQLDWSGWELGAIEDFAQLVEVAADQEGVEQAAVIARFFDPEREGLTLTVNTRGQVVDKEK